jgi:hypothetical protein
MAKTKLERIEALKLKREKIEEQERNLIKEYNNELQKAREKHLQNRGEVLEKLLPETINLTIEQFTAFISKTTVNPFGRGKLTELISEIEPAKSES